MKTYRVVKIGTRKNYTHCPAKNEKYQYITVNNKDYILRDDTTLFTEGDRHFVEVDGSKIGLVYK